MSFVCSIQIIDLVLLIPGCIKKRLTIPDFGDSFGGFDRFPFDDIPTEFRDHFPSHWNRRFGSRDEPQPTQATSPQPHQHTTSTQTEQDQDIEHAEQDQQTPLPQYGLRNTVDLGQKSPADPSLVDADERAHRSMSAPPDTPNQTKMSGHNHQEQGHAPQHNEQTSNVRHIPIFVEGRDEPVINKSVDHGAHYADPKPTYAPPPPQPHVDRDQYFADDGPVTFHPPPNFSRAFGTPFNKGFRQGPQPFVQQKVYPQSAYGRATSPQRGQSPKPQPHVDEHYVKVPVHHEQSAPKTEAPHRAQKSPQQQQPSPRPQQQAPPPQQPQPQQQQQHQLPTREPTPPKPQPPTANDPITLILSIQTDVLNLMTEVENFKGAKNDKKYLFLDEMLTRNLIKLDNIETDGKENIRQARKEAIKCIQKCIAVLEAKAESNAAKHQAESVPQQEAMSQQEAHSQPQDVEMKENTDVPEKVLDAPAVEQVTQNGEVDIEDDKEANAESEPILSAAEATPAVQEDQASKEEKTENDEPKTQEKPADNKDTVTTENNEVAEPQVADTRPDETKVPEAETISNAEQKVEDKDKKTSPKKATKTTKRRDKSKDKKEDSNKEEKVEDVQNKTEQREKLELMQVDDKGDKTDSQVMEVDGAASQ